MENTLFQFAGVETSKKKRLQTTVEQHGGTFGRLNTTSERNDGGFSTNTEEIYLKMISHIVRKEDFKDWFTNSDIGSLEDSNNLFGEFKLVSLGNERVCNSQIELKFHTMFSARTVGMVDVGRNTISLSVKKPFNQFILLFKEGEVFKSVLVEPKNQVGWENTLNKLLKDNNDNNDNNDNDDKNNKNNKNINASLPVLNTHNPHLENNDLKQRFDQFEKETIQPVLYIVGTLGFKGLRMKNIKMGLFHKQTETSKIALYLVVQNPQHPAGVFIKLTLGSCEETSTCKYLLNLPKTIKDECNNIAQIYSYNIIYRKENEKMFFALHAIIKKKLGDDFCQKMEVDDFNGSYARRFFNFSPLIVSVSELCQPLDIELILQGIRDTPSCKMVKLILCVRWIGQCLDILNQLHFKIGILHGDISLDNMLFKPSTKQDKLDKYCKISNIFLDLVVSDLNCSVRLAQPNDRSSQFEIETMQSLQTPMVTKFPYTHYQNTFYNNVQSDNYAMAIVMAKLVRMVLFEDFEEFSNATTKSLDSFNEFGKKIIEYYESKLNDEIVDPIYSNFLHGFHELISYVILQTKQKPSLYSVCRKIYQSKIEATIKDGDL